MTISQFRKRSVALFHKANPDLENVQIRWVYGPKRCKNPEGVTMVVGQFMASADGYKPRRMFPTWFADTRKLVIG